MDKLLTVVVPSYNVEQYLPEVMPYYLDKRVLDDIEILIVDDGSRDKTAEIGLSYQNAYPGSVKLLHKENGGHGSTINYGIRFATGKYFKVIDGDDWVDTEAFVRYLAKLKETDTDLVFSPFNHINADTKAIDEVVEYPQLQEKQQYSIDDLLVLSSKQYAMHSLTIRTDILRRIPPISEHCFYVDIEYITYPLQEAKTASFIREPIYQYRLGSASQSVSMANMQKNRNMHRHVIEQLVAFYSGTPLSPAAKQIVEKKLRNLLHTQLQTYLSMPVTDDTKKEVCDFCSAMQKAIPEITGTAPGVKSKLLFPSKGKLYKPLARAYHKKHHIG